MSEAVILSAVRTPIGRYGGVLAGERPDDLAALVIREAVARAGVPVDEIEDVYFGAANQAGEDNRNVARMAALLAGLPQEVAGVTVNRLCASGLSAVVEACHAIRAGSGDLFVAGGAESMTRAPFVYAKAERAFGRGTQTGWDTTLGWRFPNPQMEAMFPLESMGETGENVAEQFEVSREDQDAFALESHRRWAAAHEAGRFDDELVPVGDVERDEHPRPDSTLEKLASLRPAFREGGTVTAGNSSGVNDGAAALVIASEERAQELGVEPLGRFVASAVAGVDPRIMGIGPIPAVRKVLARAGLEVGDLDLVELNEAFASQSLQVIRELGLDPERVNVNGGAIALGHPLGMTGARLVVTLLHELRRRDAKRGLATLCVGVGQGQAAVFERPLDTARPASSPPQAYPGFPRNTHGIRANCAIFVRQAAKICAMRTKRFCKDDLRGACHKSTFAECSRSADGRFGRLGRTSGLGRVGPGRDRGGYSIRRDPGADPHTHHDTHRSPVSSAAVSDREYGLFINGEFVEPASGEFRDLVEPATGAPLARAALAGNEDIDRAVAAAREALDGPWGKTPATERSRLLHALADAVHENRKELVELETRNVGKAISSVKGEVATAVENFRFFATTIATIAGRSHPIGGSLLFYSLREPVGVCAQIVPWNYPVMMAAWKLSPAIAAGCTVVLKPDPQTPLTALRLGELATEVGIPPGVVNVVPADGPSVGSYLVSHPGVDKVSFTGSTRSGSEVMRLASEPVKRLSLELGGKSPNLVFADANLDDASRAPRTRSTTPPARAATPGRASWSRHRSTTSSSCVSPTPRAA